MEDILSNLNLPKLPNFLNGSFSNLTGDTNTNFDIGNNGGIFNTGLCNGLDINKLLIILLLLTGKLTIESITVFPNDFTITLGTFNIT